MHNNHRDKYDKRHVMGKSHKKDLPGTGWTDSHDKRTDTGKNLSGTGFYVI